MSSASKQHVDDLLSTSQDTIAKNKSRVKLLCRLCGGSHQTHLFSQMGEASKLLEDMTISQPQLSTAFRKRTLNPPIVAQMINLVPPLVNLVDQVFNLVTSSIELVDKVVDLIPASIDPTIPLESET
jgi:hypothetical protein